MSEIRTKQDTLVKNNNHFFGNGLALRQKLNWCLSGFQRIPDFEALLFSVNEYVIDFLSLMGNISILRMLCRKYRWDPIASKNQHYVSALMVV